LRKILPNVIPIRLKMTEPLASFEEGRPNKKNKIKMSSDMRSVPDLKNISRQVS